MKTIDFKHWVKAADKTEERARFILSHFDVSELKRRRKSPGRATRRSAKRR